MTQFTHYWRSFGRIATSLLLLTGFWMGLVGVASAAEPLPPSKSIVESVPDLFNSSAQFLPLVGTESQHLGRSTCRSIPGSSYASLPVLPPSTGRPAAEHADLNLARRGYAPLDADKGLIWLDGPTDPLAPKLQGLFQPQRHPPISATYQVYDWDWDCNCLGELLAEPEVTLVALKTTSHETLHVPESGYEIGGGYEVLVLYATPESITLKYTRTDNVVSGYTVHVEDICVEDSLLTLYETLDAAGRTRLPALAEGQAFGRANGGAIHIAIRDTGQFMDPRSYKDWW